MNLIGARKNEYRRCRSKPKAPIHRKKGTIVDTKRSYGVPSTCEIAWEDGTFSAVWQSDVKIIIELCQSSRSH